MQWGPCSESRKTAEKCTIYSQRVAGPLLPIGSEEREVLGVGSIHVAILLSCQYMKVLHYNFTDMNIVR